MIKNLRIKHYSYGLLMVLLVGFSLFNVISSLRVARADEGRVSISSPTQNEEINQQTRQITGTAPALKELTVYDGTTKIGTTTSSSGGTWSLEWKNPEPGEHDLKATVADGELYRSDVFSKESVKNHNVNSGQVTQSYDAGLSGTTGVVYDNTLQKTFIINYLAGTISQVNPLSQTVEDSFVYNTDPAPNGLLGGDYAYPIKYNTFCSLDPSVVSVCAYTYSQSTHKLYILDNTKLFIINTQSKTLESSVDVGVPYDGNSYLNQDLGYALYSDPQDAFVYISRRTTRYGPGYIAMAATTRVNLQTKAVDDAWDTSLDSVVTTATGDTYLGTWAYNEPASIKVIRAGSSTAEVLDVGGVCDRGVTQLALSEDDSHLYAACTDGLDALKTAVVSTSDGQLIATEDRTGEFLTFGNLTSQKLVIATTDNTSFQVLNTQTNQLVSSIQPIVGALQKQSLVVDGENEKFYFATIDTSNSLNHLYEVDLNSSGIVNDRTYPLTEFYGVRSARLAGPSRYSFIPTQGNESLHTISLSNGANSKLQEGMGSSGTVLYSDVAKRIFTTSAQLPLGTTNPISVASIVDASYEAKINLPGQYSVVSATLNEEGSVLYVLGVDYTLGGSDNVMKVFSINTANLEITRIYNSLNQYAPGESPIKLRKIVVNGDLLAFAENTGVDNKIEITTLNLENDSAQQVEITEESTADTLYERMIPDVAISPDGTRIAILQNTQYITIHDATTLAEVKKINTFGEQGFAGKGTTLISYDTNETLMAVTSGFMYEMIIDTGTLKYFDVNSGDTVSSVKLSKPTIAGKLSGCFPTDIRKSGTEGYINVDSLCFAFGAENQASAKGFVNVIDQEKKTVVHGKAYAEYGDTTAPISLSIFGYNAGSTIVSSAERQVKVIADAVTITSPTQNQEVKPGEREITGTAPPNGTVDIKVDGTSIGSVESNEYGAWEKQHTFTSDKTYTIKADYSKASNNVLYIPSMTPYDGDSFYSGKINVLSTDTNEFEDSITFPDGYSSLNVRVSKDGTKIFAFAQKLTLTPTEQFSDYRLLVIDIKSAEILSSTDFAGTSSTVNNLIGIGMLAELSADEQRVYIQGEDGLRIYTIDGVFQKIIEFTPNLYGEGSSAGLPRLIMADNIDRAYLIRPHSSITIDLENNNVEEAVLPESTTILTATYEPNSKLGVSVMLDSDTGQVTATAINFGTGEGEYVWTAELTNMLVGPQSLISNDGKQLIMSATNPIEGTFGVVQVRLSDGHVVPYLNVPPQDTLTAIASMLGELGDAVSLNKDITESKIYATLYSPVLTGAIATYTNDFRNNEEDWGLIAQPEEDESFQIYGNFGGGNRSASVPGETLSAQRSFKVISTVKPPVVPPVLPPVVEVIINPPTPVKPPSIKPVTAAVVESKQRFIEEAEKAVLSKSPFSALLASTRGLFARIPLPIMKALPYLLYLIILALAAYYLYETQKQLRREDRIRSILKKQKLLTEEKRNFLELTSHYLRTPLTYIRSGAEMVARKVQNKDLESDLSQSVNHLSLFIESLVEEAGASQIKTVEVPEKVVSPLLSKNFMLPAAGLIGTLGLFHILTSGAVGVRFDSATYLTHVVLTILILRILYGMQKNNKQVNIEKEHLKQILETERQLDLSRSKLLSDAGEQLMVRTEHISGLASQLTDDETSKKIIHQGTTRLQELARTFSLVSHLESKAIGGKAEPIAVRGLAADVIKPFTSTLQEKNIKLTVEGFDPGVTFTTNKAFAQLTLKSLIQNAIDASKEGTSITIKCLHSNGRIAFQVIDHGEGIPKEKLSQLFKPFMRVGPVTTFNREGIGLSLFIDRLIMHALGGEVEIMSKLKEGTVATLWFRENPAV